MMIAIAEFYEMKKDRLRGGPQGPVDPPDALGWALSRPLSLDFRLFGNIFAGEVCWRRCRRGTIRDVSSSVWAVRRLIQALIFPC